MNIFTIFFYKILTKYSPNRTKLHHGFATRCFSKNILTPLPRNEILDTPLGPFTPRSDRCNY